MVVGNKGDLSDKVKITADDGKKQCKEWNYHHFTVSAKTSQVLRACVYRVCIKLFVYVLYFWLGYE